MNAPANRHDWSTARPLILAEVTDTDLVEALCTACRAQGADAAVAGYGDTTGRTTSSHVFAILPRASEPADGPARLGRMVHRLAAAVARCPVADATTITFVQFGGGTFGTPDTDPEACGTAAFARSLHLERPGLRVRVVDLAASLPVDTVAGLVLAESTGPEPFRAAGYDAAGRRVEPRARLLQPAAYMPRPITWSAEDVVLVTGGAKGITAECALALGRDTRVRLALVGSSPATAEVTRTLQRFRAEGLTCEYFSCDVTDAGAVARLVTDVRARLGPVTGVVHGAGVNKPRRVEQAGPGDALAEVAPKVLGAWNLCRALDDAPPKLFVGLTSIIGVTGMPGNAWYAFSNETLDLTLRGFEARHPATAVQSIAYSVWAETGMGARMGSVEHLARQGIAAIPTEEGVRRFVQLVRNDPGRKQVVVTARLAGLDTWPVDVPEAPSGLRFVDRVVSLQPGVELVARTRLTLERDPYVGDHIYRGSYLFPTVFGLEAMTQAAAHLLGTAAPQVARFEDVRLERPIVVDPQHGAEIEIRAEAAEVDRNGEQAVRVGIRTEQSGFAVDHFAATLVLTAPADGPTVVPPRDAEPLPLVPQSDLYGGLLFQGPRFQRMGQVYELDADHTVFESVVEPDDRNAVAGFGAGANRLLLGDPFFRDVLLQAGQLTIPREVCLPVRIERLERFAGNAASARRFVFAPYKERHGREYRAEIFTTDEHGRMLERLTGYWLRILEDHPENPTAADLANPGPRDEQFLRSALDEAGRALDVCLPTVALAAGNLHSLPKEERHRRERPLVTRAVREQLGLAPDQAPNADLRWTESGKPVLMTVPGSPLDVSLSHDERTCLCVVGRGPQGCDVAPVEDRGETEWIELLGEARRTLLGDLVRRGDPAARAGARVWSAVEVVRKATQAADVTLAVERAAGEAILFRVTEPASDCFILTMPVRLTFGPVRMVALLVAGRPAAVAPMPTPAGVNPAWHSVSVAHDGPQGQPVQELRFVVSFQESSTLSRKVPASRYLQWMGKMRELVTSTGVPELVPLIASGEWGLVTNWADVRVTGEATANDIIQMRFWTDPPNGSEVEFFCDFWKVGPGDRRERVAFGSQKATWVRLVGHGQVEPAPLPDGLAAFLARMGPREVRTVPLPSLAEPLAAWESGAVLYQAPAGPRTAGVLRRETFQTTLEEANLVGNVYFANYFTWQGRVRDLFLNAVAPEYLRGVGERGEMVCLHSRVDYLREAMPFDRVEVVLALRELRAGGAVFGFEYYRVAPDESRQKLSVGVQEVAWVERGTDGSARPAPFPPAVRQAFLARVTAKERKPATRTSKRETAVTVS